MTAEDKIIVFLKQLKNQYRTTEVITDPLFKAGFMNSLEHIQIIADVYFKEETEKLNEMSNE